MIQHPPSTKSQPINQIEVATQPTTKVPNPHSALLWGTKLTARLQAKSLIVRYPKRQPQQRPSVIIKPAFVRQPRFGKVPTSPKSIFQSQALHLHKSEHRSISRFRPTQRKVIPMISASAAPVLYNPVVPLTVTSSAQQAITTQLYSSINALPYWNSISYRDPQLTAFNKVTAQRLTHTQSAAEFTHHRFQANKIGGMSLATQRSGHSLMSPIKTKAFALYRRHKLGEHLSEVLHPSTPASFSPAFLAIRTSQPPVSLISHDKVMTMAYHYSRASSLNSYRLAALYTLKPQTKTGTTYYIHRYLAQHWINRVTSRFYHKPRPALFPLGLQRPRNNSTSNLMAWYLHFRRTHTRLLKKLQRAINGRWALGAIVNIRKELKVTIERYTTCLQAYKIQLRLQAKVPATVWVHGNQTNPAARESTKTAYARFKRKDPYESTLFYTAQQHGLTIHQNWQRLRQNTKALHKYRWYPRLQLLKLNFQARDWTQTAQKYRQLTAAGQEKKKYLFKRNLPHLANVAPWIYHSTFSFSRRLDSDSIRKAQHHQLWLRYLLTRRALAVQHWRTRLQQQELVTTRHLPRQPAVTLSMAQRCLSHPERQLMSLKTKRGLAKIQRQNYQLQHRARSRKRTLVRAGKNKRQRKITSKSASSWRGRIKRRRRTKKLVSVFLGQVKRQRKITAKQVLHLRAKRRIGRRRWYSLLITRRTKRVARRLDRRFKHRLQQLHHAKLTQRRPIQRHKRRSTLLSIKNLIGQSVASSKPHPVTTNQHRSPVRSPNKVINQPVAVKAPHQFTPARRPASQRRPMFYDPLKPTGKRQFATQRLVVTKALLPVSRSASKVMSARLPRQRSGLGQPTDKRGRIVVKNQHLRELGAEYYRYKQAGTKPALVQRQISSRIALYWRLLTQNSPYYQKGWFMPGTATKFDTLSQLSSDFDKRRYIGQRTHRIDITANDEVRFNLAPLKYKTIYKDNSDKLFDKVDDYYVVRIPIFFDPYLGNGKLQQPWLTYVRGGLLMVVEPINHTVYYVNTAVARAVNLEIRYIQPHTWQRKLPTKRPLSAQRRYYVLKQEQNFTHTHFIQLYHPQSAVSITAQSWTQRQSTERLFKGGVPVLALSAFRNPTSHRQPAKCSKQRHRRLNHRYQLVRQLVNRRLDLLQRAWLAQALNAGQNDNMALGLVSTQNQLRPTSLLTKTQLVALAQRPMRRTLAKLWAAHNNEIRYYHRYEYRAFKWKFFARRWYFAYSRWKRAILFRGLMRKAWANYRKLQKNPLFIKLLRVHLYHALGMQEADIWQLWRQIRRGQNYNHTISAVKRFNQSLQLKLDSLAMFLGLAPNRPAAQQLVICGSLRINGLVVTDYNTTLAVNDMLQVDLSIRADIRFLYTETHWDRVEARVKMTSFLQAMWPMMMFMMVRWPYQHELMEESVLNERWIRYYIRYFPIKVAKYRQPKVEWLKY